MWDARIEAEKLVDIKYYRRQRINKLSSLNESRQKAGAYMRQ